MDEIKWSTQIMINSDDVFCEMCESIATKPEAAAVFEAIKIIRKYQISDIGLAEIEALFELRLEGLSG